MFIKSVHHITINLKHEKETVEFYEGLLGLKRLPDVDMGDHRLLYFELPDNMRLEFIDRFGHSPSIKIPADNQGSARHFAFEVEDVYQFQERIRELGLEIVAPAKRVDKLSFIGFVAKEPNGFELEFIQRI